MTVAIVGRTGSGKSYAAKGMVEPLLERQSRVVVIDPTGAWWGIRLEADGKQPAYPAVILGGDHADVPLDPDQGQRLAELVAGGAINQAVVDISEMSGAEQTRFLTNFLEALYAQNRRPLTLVMDEADVMAPQNPLPEQRRLQGAVNKIVRRGRIKGFQPIMITQRPAVLDKSVLSQIDTLVAMRLTSPQDRKAIEDWVKGSADAEQAKPVLDSLASLQRGEGWIWAPAEDRLERTHFPSIKTFDSSRTPDGEDQPDIRPLELGVDEIVAALAKPDDKGAGRPPLPGEVEAAEARGRAQGFKEGEAQGLRLGIEMGIARARAALDALSSDTSSTSAVKPSVADTVFDENPKVLAKGQGLRPEPESTKLSPTARRIIDAIHSAYPVSLTFKAAALRAGASPRSSQFRQYEREVSASLEVEKRGDRLVSACPGARRAPGPALDPVEEFATKLPPSHASMLRVLAVGPGSMTRDEIADRAGVSRTSSGLSAGLRELEAMELISRDGAGRFALSPDLRDARAPGSEAGR